MGEVPGGLPRLPFRVSVSPSTNGEPHGPLAPRPARSAGRPRSDPRPPRRPRGPASVLPSAAPGRSPHRRRRPPKSGLRFRARRTWRPIGGRAGSPRPLGDALPVLPRAPLPWCRGCVRRLGCHALAAWLWTAYRCGAAGRVAPRGDSPRPTRRVAVIRARCAGHARGPAMSRSCRPARGGREQEGTPLLGVGGPRCERWGSRPWSGSSARLYLCDLAAAPSWPVSAPVSSDDFLTSLDLSFLICCMGTAWALELDLGSNPGFKRSISETQLARL